jgi:site-specific DNA recombinase
MLAGVYARISEADEGDTKGVTRQIQDCLALAEVKGWTVSGTYCDNDVSATKRKPRPEYQRLLADIRAQRLHAIVVWDVDRLTRSPRELEDVIDLADEYGLQLASVGGEIDLANPQGRLTARIKGSVGRHETDQMRRRVTRKIQEMAEAGIPHGPVRYGWRRVVEFDGNGRRVGFHDELHDHQAGIVRELATRVLNGESMRSLAIELNDRGERTMRGDSWRAANITRLLVRPGNGGLRQHQGKVIGPSLAPGILDLETHEQLVALLTDPTRRTTQLGGTRRHLLTGLARCGIEGCPGTVGVTRHGSGRTLYQCRVCWGVSRAQIPTDDFVQRVMIGRLTRPDALDALAGDPDALVAARAKVKAIKAKLAKVADQFVDDVLTPEQVTRINTKLRAQLQAAEAERDSALPARVPSGMTGPDAEKRWNAASLDVQRALIDVLMVPVILPLGAGKRFDPDRIRIDWK